MLAGGWHVPEHTRVAMGSLSRLQRGCIEKENALAGKGGILLKYSGKHRLWMKATVAQNKWGAQDCAAAAT